MRELVVKDNPNPLSETECSPVERLMQLREQEEKERKAREREKKSRFPQFLQYNEKHLSILLKISEENRTAFKIFVFILENMDKLNAVVCSYQVLQERFKISRSTASRAVKYLKDNGYVGIYKSGTSNVYVLNPDIAWKNTGDKVKYCRFPANVVLSSSEQEKMDFDKLKVLKEKES